MVNRPNTAKSRQARHKRVRGKIHGTAQCPRLNVFRSLKHIYAQLIDDDKGVTLAAASTVEKDFAEYGGNIDAVAMHRPNPDFTNVTIDLTVWDLKHLSAIISELREKRVISRVERVVA